MRSCKKCGNGWVSGPRLIGEYTLKFVCTCGYSWTEPTHDAHERKAPAPLRKLMADELAKARRVTKEEIREAIRQGEIARRKAMGWS